LTCLGGEPTLQLDRAEPSPAEDAMKRWQKPKIVEIAVGMEINSYACAVVR
jgi:coenzyme PQQ precursor peptide PqqA